jgi:uroporphyrinogen-III decarboxylase
MIDEMLDVLEKKLELFLKQILKISLPVLLLPDNLDSNFIYPAVFEEYCDKGYRKTARMAHERGRRVVVHVGGAIRSLLGLIGKTGVDVLEGIAGPPQSDASLADARDSAGSRITLWGGIPQDYLLNTYDQNSFESAVRTAASTAARDPKIILGIADRVPVDADINRIRAVGELAGIR